MMGQGLELGQQFGAALDGERCHDADVVQIAVVVVQPEQQRSDPVAVFVDAVAGDHAVGGALMLDLDQRALVGRVRVAQPLGDHAVEAGALELGEPALSDSCIGCVRAQVDRGCRVGELRGQQLMPFRQRTIEQRVVVEG